MHWFDQFIYDSGDQQLIVAESKSTQEWHYSRFNAYNFKSEIGFSITAGDTDFTQATIKHMQALGSAKFALFM